MSDTAQRPSVQIPDADEIYKSIIEDVPSLAKIGPRVRLIAMFLTNKPLGISSEMAIRMITSSVQGVTRDSIMDAIDSALTVVNHAAAALATRISDRTTRAINPGTFADLDSIRKSELTEQDTAQSPADALTHRLDELLAFFNAGKERVADLWKAEQNKSQAKESSITRIRRRLSSALEKVVYEPEPQADVMQTELNWATVPALAMNAPEVERMIEQLTFMEQLRNQLQDGDNVLLALKNITWDPERIANLIYAGKALCAKQVNQSETIRGLAEAESASFALEIAKIKAARALLAEAQTYAGA